MAPHNPNSLIDSSIGLSVRHWPESEQPRERLLTRGPDSLSDAELLAIFLRVGVIGNDGNGPLPLPAEEVSRISRAV